MRREPICCNSYEAQENVICIFKWICSRMAIVLAWCSEKCWGIRCMKHVKLITSENFWDHAQRTERFVWSKYVQLKYIHQYNHQSSLSVSVHAYVAWDLSFKNLTISSLTSSPIYFHLNETIFLHAIIVFLKNLRPSFKYRN